MASIFSAQKENKRFDLKSWVLEPRPQFLLLPVVLILVGTSVALYEGVFNISYALLSLLGLLLCHMSVNILNDYFDYKSGVDLKVVRTPFSGGSGMLPTQRLKPSQVGKYGLICLLLAVPIGMFFTLVQGWLLFPLLIAGAMCVIFYTPIILKIDFPEWSAGIGLGVLPVLGAYYVQTAGYSWPALIASIPSGILVLNLLLLNEFPDVEADKIDRRRTLPIRLGRKKAAVVYASLTILVYLWIAGSVITGRMPVPALVSLLTLPFAVKAVAGSFASYDINRIVPAMGNNVIVVLLTQALLGLGYILAAML